MRTELPATFEAIERVFAEFRGRCDCIRVHKECFQAELLLREALTNAVVHGCRGDRSKSILCTVRVKGARLIIAVEDGGAGFDWRAALSRQADPSACSGRGMEIFRKYATRVRFSEKGNRVTLIKDFKGEAQSGPAEDGAAGKGRREVTK